MDKEIRNFLLKVVSTSDTLKYKISNKELKQLIEAIALMPNEKIINLYNLLKEEELERKIDQSMAVASVVVPGGIPLYVFYRILKSYNYKCGNKCINKNENDKKLCYKICDVKSIEKTIKIVKKEINDCWYYKNPKKCRKQNISYLRTLYDRLEKAQERLISYETKLKIRKNK